jgi:predicted aldo/keto reductase-like oxidoreductase
MLYRKMPRVKEDLSILGFGCMRFPILEGDITKIDEEKAEELLKYAIDNGVNYIDTAYPYHGASIIGGASEPFVGRVLASGYRDKVMLASKLPCWFIEKMEDMDFFINKQLKRLQTDHIDFYLVHALNLKFWKSLVPLGVKEFLDRAKEDGRIRYAGFSFHDDSVDLFKEIIDAYDWDFCQIQYNYLDENYQAGREGLEYAAKKGLGLVVMEPLKGGSLAVNMPDDANIVFEAANPDRKPVDWALSWLWNQKDVHVVLSGMNTLEQVVENIKIAAEAKVGCFNRDEIEAVNSVKDIMHSIVKVDCTTCGYCMPCPEGVDIPRNFSYYNDYHRFDDDKIRANSHIIYNSVLSEGQKALSCVECGTCEPLCPQNIPIIDKLKDVAKTMS